MKTQFLAIAIYGSLVLTAGLPQARGHDSVTGEEHGHYDRSVKPPEFYLAQAQATFANVPVQRIEAALPSRPGQAAAFDKFMPEVKVRWDERFLFVESRGLPAHNMMVGITAWQQQVPLPQNYTGVNAWQIPLVPVAAKAPASIRNRFLRGAIALAVNGIPIFNPQNNRGEVSAEIGELDEWGGHCGRADDYHYHAAPLHLQSVVGKALPIAYALDGYGIYGLTDPDGSTPTGLDAFNGHTTAALGYHYHASTKYPYVNGGFHGEVVERGEQVDPQPHAQAVRPALPALRDAKITGFTNSPDGRARSLTYMTGRGSAAVNYADAGGGSWKFQFVSADGSKQEETYQAREAGSGQGGERPEAAGPPRSDERGGPPRSDERGGPPRSDERGGPPPRREDQGPERRGAPREDDRAGASVSAIGMDALKKPSGTFVLSSPEIAADGRLPMEYTGDGRGATLPLAWQGAPSGTQSYALVMDHLAPGNVVKSYWTMWDIPAMTTSLPKNVRGVGQLGTSFKGQLGYEPPHSQGPGPKTYVLTVYALAAPPQISQAPREVTREVLLAAIKDRVLGSASMNVVYARAGSDDAAASRRPPGGEDASAPPPPPKASPSDRTAPPAGPPPQP